jgi:hypothetical protein
LGGRERELTEVTKVTKVTVTFTAEKRRNGEASGWGRTAAT